MHGKKNRLLYMDPSMSISQECPDPSLPQEKQEHIDQDN
jgi:hypothetical protein